MTLLESINDRAEKKYVGKIKKAGSHGVLVRENREAYISGCKEQHELDMEFVKWKDGLYLEEKCGLFDRGFAMVDVGNGLKQFALSELFEYFIEITKRKN